MSHPARTVPESAPAYHEDAYGWAMAQGRFLRERRFDAVDWDNVAEEIETMGRSERRSLRSNLVQLLLHIIKWDAQPARRGTSWLVSIANHREEALRDLAENPSLQPQLDDIFADALKSARRMAGQQTGLDASVIDRVALTVSDAFDREFEQPDRD